MILAFYSRTEITFFLFDPAAASLSMFKTFSQFCKHKMSTTLWHYSTFLANFNTQQIPLFPLTNPNLFAKYSHDALYF